MSVLIQVGAVANIFYKRKWLCVLEGHFSSYQKNSKVGKQRNTINRSIIKMLTSPIFIYQFKICQHLQGRRRGLVGVWHEWHFILLQYEVLIDTPCWDVWVNRHLDTRHVKQKIFVICRENKRSLHFFKRTDIFSAGTEKIVHFVSQRTFKKLKPVICFPNVRRTYERL